MIMSSGKFSICVVFVFVFAIIVTAQTETRHDSGITTTSVVPTAATTHVTETTVTKPAQTTTHDGVTTAVAPTTATPTTVAAPTTATTTHNQSPTPATTLPPTPTPKRHTPTAISRDTPTLTVSDHPSLTLSSTPWHTRTYTTPLTEMLTATRSLETRRTDSVSSTSTAERTSTSSGDVTVTATATDEYTLTSSVTHSSSGGMPTPSATHEVTRTPTQPQDAVFPHCLPLTMDALSAPLVVRPLPQQVPVQSPSAATVGCLQPRVDTGESFQVCAAFGCNVHGTNATVEAFLSNFTRRPPGRPINDHPLMATMTGFNTSAAFSKQLPPVGVASCIVTSLTMRRFAVGSGSVGIAFLSTVAVNATNGVVSSYAISGTVISAPIGSFDGSAPPSNNWSTRALTLAAITPSPSGLSLSDGFYHPANWSGVSSDGALIGGYGGAGALVNVVWRYDNTTNVLWRYKLDDVAAAIRCSLASVAAEIVAITPIVSFVSSQSSTVIELFAAAVAFADTSGIAVACVVMNTNDLRCFVLSDKLLPPKVQRPVWETPILITVTASRAAVRMNSSLVFVDDLDVSVGMAFVACPLSGAANYQLPTMNQILGATATASGDWPPYCSPGTSQCHYINLCGVSAPLRHTVRVGDGTLTTWSVWGTARFGGFVNAPRFLTQQVSVGTNAVFDSTLAATLTSLFDLSVVSYGGFGDVVVLVDASKIQLLHSSSGKIVRNAGFMNFSDSIQQVFATVVSEDLSELHLVMQISGGLMWTIVQQPFHSENISETSVLARCFSWVPLDFDGVTHPFVVVSAKTMLTRKYVANTGSILSTAIDVMATLAVDGIACAVVVTLTVASGMQLTQRTCNVVDMSGPNITLPAVLAAWGLGSALLGSLQVSSFAFPAPMNASDGNATKSFFLPPPKLVSFGPVVQGSATLTTMGLRTVTTFDSLLATSTSPTAPNSSTVITSSATDVFTCARSAACSWAAAFASHIPCLTACVVNGSNVTTGALATTSSPLLVVSVPEDDGEVCRVALPAPCAQSASIALHVRFSPDYVEPTNLIVVMCAAAPQGATQAVREAIYTSRCVELTTAITLRSNPRTSTESALTDILLVELAPAGVVMSDAANGDMDVMSLTPVLLLVSLYSGTVWLCPRLVTSQIPQFTTVTELSLPSIVAWNVAPSSATRAAAFRWVTASGQLLSLDADHVTTLYFLSNVIPTPPFTAPYYAVYNATSVRIVDIESTVYRADPAQPRVAVVYSPCALAPITPQADNTTTDLYSVCIAMFDFVVQPSNQWIPVGWQPTGPPVAVSAINGTEVPEGWSDTIQCTWRSGQLQCPAVSRYVSSVSSYMGTLHVVVSVVNQPDISAFAGDVLTVPPYAAVLLYVSLWNVTTGATPNAVAVAVDRPRDATATVVNGDTILESAAPFVPSASRCLPLVLGVSGVLDILLLRTPQCALVGMDVAFSGHVSYTPRLWTRSTTFAYLPSRARRDLVDSFCPRVGPSWAGSADWPVAFFTSSSTPDHSLAFVVVDFANATLTVCDVRSGAAWASKALVARTMGRMLRVAPAAYGGGLPTGGVVIPSGGFYMNISETIPGSLDNYTTVQWVVSHPALYLAAPDYVFDPFVVLPLLTSTTPPDSAAFAKSRVLLNLDPSTLLPMWRARSAFTSWPGVVALSSVVIVSFAGYGLRGPLGAPEYNASFVLPPGAPGSVPPVATITAIDWGYNPALTFVAATSLNAVLAGMLLMTALRGLFLTGCSSLHALLNIPDAGRTSMEGVQFLDVSYSGVILNSTVFIVSPAVLIAPTDLPVPINYTQWLSPAGQGQVLYPLWSSMTFTRFFATGASFAPPVMPVMPQSLQFLEVRRSGLQGWFRPPLCLRQFNETTVVPANLCNLTYLDVSENAFQDQLSDMSMVISDIVTVFLWDTLTTLLASKTNVTAGVQRFPQEKALTFLFSQQLTAELSVVDLSDNALLETSVALITFLGCLPGRLGLLNLSGLPEYNVAVDARAVPYGLHCAARTVPLVVDVSRSNISFAVTAVPYTSVDNGTAVHFPGMLITVRSDDLLVPLDFNDPEVLQQVVFGTEPRCAQDPSNPGMFVQFVPSLNGSCYGSNAVPECMASFEFGSLYVPQTTTSPYNDDLSCQFFRGQFLMEPLAPAEYFLRQTLVERAESEPTTASTDTDTPRPPSNKLLHRLLFGGSIVAAVEKCLNTSFGQLQGLGPTQSYQLRMLRVNNTADLPPAPADNLPADEACQSAPSAVLPTDVKYSVVLQLGVTANNETDASAVQQWFNFSLLGCAVQNLSATSQRYGGMCLPTTSLNSFYRLSLFGGESIASVVTTGVTPSSLTCAVRAPVVLLNSGQLLNFALGGADEFAPFQSLQACLPMNQFSGLLESCAVGTQDGSFTCSTRGVPANFATEWCASSWPCVVECATLPPPPTDPMPVVMSWLDTRARSIVWTMCTDAPRPRLALGQSASMTAFGFFQLGRCERLEKLFPTHAPLAYGNAAVNELVSQCSAVSQCATGTPLATNCTQLASRLVNLAACIAVDGYDVTALPRLLNVSTSTKPSLCADDHAVQNLSTDLARGIGSMYVLPLYDVGSQTIMFTPCDATDTSTQSPTRTGGIGNDGRGAVLAFPSGTCFYGLKMWVWPCLPYIEPTAYAASYVVMVLSSLKDILFISMGLFVLGRKRVRDRTSRWLAAAFTWLLPLHAEEREVWHRRFLKRINPPRVKVYDFFDCFRVLAHDYEEEKRVANDEFGQDERYCGRSLYRPLLSGIMSFAGVHASLTGGSRRFTPNDDDDENKSTPYPTMQLKECQNRQTRESKESRELVPGINGCDDDDDDSGLELRPTARSEGMTSVRGSTATNGLGVRRLQGQLFNWLRRRHKQSAKAALVPNAHVLLSDLELGTQTGTVEELSSAALADDTVQPGLPSSGNLMQWHWTENEFDVSKPLFVLFLKYVCSNGREMPTPESSRTREVQRLALELFRTWSAWEGGAEALDLGERVMTEQEKDLVRRLRAAITFDEVMIRGDAVERKFTPQTWMLLLQGGYCFLLLCFVAVEVPMAIPTASGWTMYQAIYFRYINSASSVSLITNAMLRRFYLEDMRIDGFVAFSLVLLLPALITHVLVAAVMYSWLVLAVFVPFGLFVFVHTFARRFWTRLSHDRPWMQRNSNKLLWVLNASWRIGVTLAASMMIQTLFNYAVLFYERKALGLSYVSVIAYEWESRNIACTLAGIEASMANVMQFMSTFA